MTQAHVYLACWLAAMLLVMATPMSLLFGVAWWRVLIVLLIELMILAWIGWLKK